MPARTQTMRTPYASSKTTVAKFELPTFSFDKESLVAGTNLPAPSREPSPAPPAKKEQLATTSAEAQTQSKSTENGGALSQGNNNNTTSHATANTATTPADAAAGMKRPHQVRRLLSIRSLSQTFSSHGRTDSDASGMSGSDFGPTVRRSRTPSIFGGRTSTSTWGTRPGSRGGASTVGSTLEGVPEGRRSFKKRMSGGFWSRRSSFGVSRLVDDQIPENGVATIDRKRTPPPQLPEIGKLKLSKAKNESGGYLNGEDMFKGIEYKPEI